MSFHEIRWRVIQAIIAGRIQHAVRSEIEEKNLLLVGDVTPAQVIRLLRSCKGTQYSSSGHHFVPGVLVHVFRPEVGMGNTKEYWYIKIYFMEPDVWFISVHKSRRHFK